MRSLCTLNCRCFETGLGVDQVGEMERATRNETPRAEAPPLVLTKLFAPSTDERTLPRDRLVERLHAGSGLRLTLIAAPAGFGKTTLLAAWRESEVRRPVAWLSVDEGDADPVVLWAHVIEALRQVATGPCRALSPQLARSVSIIEIVLPSLINALAEEHDIALVFDDYHRLAAGPARDSVAWFVEHAPRNIQIVISTRREPLLRLPAMRAHGELAEVRADDLRFTEDEAATWFRDRLHLDLAPEDVDTLVRRIEGWPAGLYLASLSLPDASDVHDFVIRFGASSRHVAEFLVAEVLDSYEPAVQAFMLRSSILGDMCASMCDAVTGRDGSGALLAPLARSNLFLVPLDGTGTWYRFHHLFAQFLRIELERREPGITPSLHRRAFRWCLDNDRHGDAIDHALEAGAFDDAAEILASEWIVHVNACRFATLLGWVDRFPRSRWDDDVRLRLVEAWALSLSGHRDEAARAMAVSEALSAAPHEPLLDGFSSVESSLTMLRAVFPWGDTRSLHTAAARALSLEQEGSPWRPVALWAMGFGHYYQGDFQEAERWFIECLAVAPGSEQWLVAGSSLAYRSMIAGEQGRSADRRRLAEQGAQFVRDRGLESVVGEVPLALAASSLADGRAEEALGFAERATDVLRGWGQPIDLADALLQEVAVLRALGDYERASDSLAEARGVVESCPAPGILADRLAELTPTPTRYAGTGNGDLTERELIVLRLLRGTLSEREIGQELFLTFNTIHSHTRAIYKKLGVSSRTQAIEEARSRGLI